MITKEELQERFKKKMRESSNPMEDFAVIFGENLQYYNEHYSEMDDEAKKMVDEQIEHVGKINDEWVETVRKEPDSLAKRKTIRLHRKIKGTHFNAEDLLRKLEKPGTSDAFTDEAHEIFISLTQAAYDYLCDITDNPTIKGGSEIVFLGLFFSCLDEAIVAFYLATHTLAAQSMAHTRHVKEALDLIVLFEKDSSHIEHWISEDHKERQKVSPKEVRKLLGTDALEEGVYWMLSDIGSHPSFKNLRTKTAQKVVDGEPTNHFTVSVGGVADKFHSEQAIIACLSASLKLLTIISRHFEPYLLEEELRKDLEDIPLKMKAFLEKYDGYDLHPEEK